MRAARGDSDAGAYGGRFRTTRIMEALAEQSRDLEEQAAVRSRDYHVLRIAELCLKHDSAELAPSGVPERPDRGCEHS